MAEKERVIQSGFIAQEVEQAAVSAGYDFSGVDAPKNEDDFYGLRYAEFVVPLVKAMQEQQFEIRELRQQNTDLLRNFQNGERTTANQLTANGRVCIREKKSATDANLPSKELKCEYKHISWPPFCVRPCIQ